MIIERKPTAHRLSSSPGLKANGRVAAAHSGKTPQVTDKLDLSKVPARRTFRYLALTALALTGAVAGHATNVTPSAVIADLTGSQRLEDLRFLDQHGELTQGSAEAAYRAMGVQIGEIRYHNHTFLKLPNGNSFRLDDHGEVAEMAGYLRGQYRWGLSQEEMTMAAEISQYPGLSRGSYGDELDSQGVVLARGLQGRGISVNFDREHYVLKSPEDLRELHDFFLGDSFTPEQQRLHWALRMLSGYRKENLLEAFEALDAGEPVDFATTHNEVTYQTELSNREELYEFAQRILNARENESYQPYPEEISQAAVESLPAVARDLNLARAQFEAVRGMTGVDPATLETRLERLEQVERRLVDLERQAAQWSGGESQELREATTALVEGLRSLASSPADWDPLGPQRVQRLVQKVESLRAVVQLTSKPQAPEGWSLLPALEGRYPTNGNSYLARPEVRFRRALIDPV